MNLLQQTNSNIENFINEATEILNSLSPMIQENIEWEPQPEWRGKGGETKDTSIGIKNREENQRKAMIDKIRTAYRKAQQALETADPIKRKSIQNAIVRLEGLAKKYNIELQSPALKL